MNHFEVERDSFTFEFDNLFDMVEEVLRQADPYIPVDLEIKLNLRQHTSYLHNLESGHFPEFQLEVDAPDLDVEPEALQSIIRQAQLRTFPDPNNLTDAERAQLLFIAYNDPKDDTDE